MRILLGYAFLERRLNKFNCTVLETNAGSLAMMMKLGCKQEGVRRQTVYMQGRYMNEIMIGLTQEEFHENERQHVGEKDVQ